MMYVYSSEGNESPMKDYRTPCADCGENVTIYEGKPFGRPYGMICAECDTMPDVTLTAVFFNPHPKPIGMWRLDFSQASGITIPYRTWEDTEQGRESVMDFLDEYRVGVSEFLTMGLPKPLDQRLRVIPAEAHALINEPGLSTMPAATRLVAVDEVKEVKGHDGAATVWGIKLSDGRTTDYPDVVTLRKALQGVRVPDWARKILPAIDPDCLACGVVADASVHAEADCPPVPACTGCVEKFMQYPQMHPYTKNFTEWAKGEDTKPLKLKPYFSDHVRRAVFPETLEIMVEGPPPTEESIRSWYPDCDESWVYAIQEQVALTKGFMPSDEEQFTAVALRAERIRAGNGTPLVGCFGAEMTAEIEKEYGPGERLELCTKCGSPCAKTSVGGVCPACSIKKERVELERDFVKHPVEERAESDPCPACHGSKRSAQAGCDTCFDLYTKTASERVFYEWAACCAPVEGDRFRACLACGEVLTHVFPEGSCNACANKWLDDVSEPLNDGSGGYRYKDNACTFDSWAKKHGIETHSVRKRADADVAKNMADVIVKAAIQETVRKIVATAALEIACLDACGCGHDALDPKDQTGIHESYCGKA